MTPIKVLASVGTRPEMIKMAPVVHELRSRQDQFTVRVLFTAQHRDMLDQMASFFGIKGDIDLNIMTQNQTLSSVTARIMERMHTVLETERPDIVLAQGDTTTVMVTALACYYLHIPFGHVEAGMRTADKHNPFPEEINRRLAGQLADLHFAPTDREREALVAEQVPCDTIVVTGNTVVDAVLGTAARDLPLPITMEPGQDLVLVTVHRRESFGQKIRNIFAAVREVAERRPTTRVVYPVHPNPNVRQAAHDMLGDIENVRLLPPVDYGSFIALMKHATLILTDSGGIQEEAPSLRVPVLVLRDVTERPQAVECGLARLVGTDTGTIVREALELLEHPEVRARMTQTANPFGDGRASGRIATAIADYLNGRKRSADA
jgi:UDP-N-acetylglucosamine 2-epimerase (non-hydrolysing)